MVLVVKVINYQMQTKHHLHQPSRSAVSVIIHCVRSIKVNQVGTSVGEGTFGKVKLGKHILTGEKVNLIFKLSVYRSQ